MTTTKLPNIHLLNALGDFPDPAQQEAIAKGFYSDEDFDAFMRNFRDTNDRTEAALEWEGITRKAKRCPCGHLHDSITIDIKPEVGTQLGWYQCDGCGESVADFYMVSRKDLRGYKYINHDEV